MEPHLQHTQGRHYDDTLDAAVAHHTGHDYDEDHEHHGEKKSVIKKVKEKAKKLKNTITKHGHGHGGDDDDDDDDEMEEDAEVHGAPMYDSARVGVGGPGAILGGNLERSSVLADDRYGRSDVAEPGARRGAPPPVSNLSEPSGLGHPQAYGQEVNPKQWRGKSGQATGIEEDPFAPIVSRAHPEESRGSIGKSTGLVKDPSGPKDPSWVGPDPSNYETKVTDPTHTGVKEAELSQIQHSLDKMGIHDKSEPKRFDPNHPEHLPRETLTGNPSSRSSSYVEKISSSASAIASKLGYSNQAPSNKPHETVTKPGSATDYAHKITDKVTETLSPVYGKVVDAGSTVISKVEGSVSGQPQVEKGVEGDEGVSMKEYLVERLRPGDDDKALSEAITHVFHRGNDEETEKKRGEDRRVVGRVTESEEVRQRLASDGGDGNAVAEKWVVDTVKDAVGSWFGGKGNAREGSAGTSHDEGLSTSDFPVENRKGGSGRE